MHTRMCIDSTTCKTNLVLKTFIRKFVGDLFGLDFPNQRSGGKVRREDSELAS